MFVAFVVAVAVHNKCSEEQLDGTSAHRHRLDSSLLLFADRPEAVLAGHNKDDSRKEPWVEEHHMVQDVVVAYAVVVVNIVAVVDAADFAEPSA